MWDVASGKQIAVLKGEGSVKTAAFSPDGQRVLTASDDNTARLWNVASGKELVVLRGHGGPVWSAAFSPDGTRVVTGSADFTTRVWDAASGKEIAVLNGHRDGVLSAAFSPDGTRVVTASYDKTARVWRVFSSTQSLVDAAQQAIPRCLTHTQREQAFLDDEPPAWCIELQKWPYHTKAWKDWLHDKRAGKYPTLPKME